MMNFLGNQTYHQKILNNFLVRWTIQKIKIVLEWPIIPRTFYEYPFYTIFEEIFMEEK
jgi:hypothetical protein